LNPIILKPEHVEERIPPPQSPVGLSVNVNSIAVAKAAEDIAALHTTHSYLPFRPVSNPLPIPSIAPPKQQTTKPKASSPGPRKPQFLKGKETAIAPKMEAGQSDDDELALLAAPAPIQAAPTRKPKPITTAEPVPSKWQDPAKSENAETVEMQPVAKKKTRAKPPRAPLNQAKVEPLPSKEPSLEPSPSTPMPPKPKKQTRTVRPE
jgi:hypothetical protein